MDKVIIDKVDVSECDSYTHNHNELMPYGGVKVTEHYCWHINSNCDGENCDYKEIKRLQAESERLKARLRPLEDSYFNGLSSIEIAELAKKSIRITAENRKLEYALQEIKEIIDFRFKTSYMTFGYKEYDKLIEDIDKIVNEVIGAEE